MYLPPPKKTPPMLRGNWQRERVDGLHEKSALSRIKQSVVAYVMLVASVFLAYGSG